MSRGIHADVITELSKDSFNMAHIVSIDFSQTVYLTDYAHDISHGGNNYESSSYLLGLSQVNETSDAQLGTFTVELSGVQQAFIAILLSENYIDRQVIIDRVILNSLGEIIGNQYHCIMGALMAFQ